MKDAFKRLFIVLFAVVVCIVAGNCSHAYAAEAAENYINIVYDDSGSMYMDDSTALDKWCNANYAMSVFAAMLGGGDTMNIYPMGQEGGCAATINGDDLPARRAEAINNIEMRGSNTYFSAVEGAYSDLKNAGSSAKKWLVILTDGMFTDKKAPAVTSALRSYADEGIQVIYLAIGKDVTRIDADPDSGFYAYYAEDSDSILPKVTVVANQIFENYQLSESYLKKSGAGLTLNFEVPMEQVTVFAQGQDISIGSLTSNQGRIDCVETVSVEASGKNIPSKYEDGRDDALKGVLASNQELRGCIATYSTAGELIPAGEYTVDISDTANVQVYARPVVEIGARFFSGGEQLLNDADLQEGDYNYEIIFLDPITGEPVESALLDDTYRTIETQITVNGETKTGEAEGPVHVTEGTLEISATAVLPSGKTIRTENNLVFSVTPKQPPDVALLLFDQNGAPAGQDGYLIAGDYRYELELIDPLLGGEADPALVNETTVTMEAADDGGTQSLSPSGGMVTATAGTLTISASTSLPNGQVKNGQPFTYEVVNKLNPIELSFSGNMQPALEDLEDAGNRLLVTGTIDGALLSEEQWNAAELTAQGSGNIKWTISKGSEASTWVLTPAYADGNVLKTKSGPDDVTVAASLTHDHQTVASEGKAHVDVQEMPFFKRLGEWLKQNWWWLLALILLALLLWAYVPKKRFKKMTYESIGRMQRGIVPDDTLTFRKVSSTRFLPFVPERGSFSGEVEQNGQPHAFSFDVEADGDQMKVISTPIFDTGDRLRVGVTMFQYQKTKGEQRIKPDLSEEEAYLAYNDDISLTMPRGSVVWRNDKT
jgi:hypothetical protein